MDNFIVFSQPEITEDDIQAVTDVLRSRWIGKGPKTTELEEIFKERTKAVGAVGLNSCTAALFLSLKVLDIGPGDEVITTAMTFAASANVIVHAGATPVFVDVEPITGNIDPAMIEPAITPKTKALLIVHYTGRPCDMDAIMDIAKRHNLRVIEDCAHAIESTYKGIPCGSFGDVGCFSFYATKNVACGEGGMLVLKDKDHYDQAAILSLHGLSRSAWNRYAKAGHNFYQVVEHGYKFNLFDIPASLALSQYRRVEESWLRREKNWLAYTEAFKDLPGVIVPPAIESDRHHAYHLFTLLLEPTKLSITREEFCMMLKEKNIGTGIHFLALHQQPAFEKTLKQIPSLPNTEFISDRTVSIPVQPSLSDEEVKYIIDTIREVILTHQK